MTAHGAAINGATTGFADYRVKMDLRSTAIVNSATTINLDDARRRRTVTATTARAGRTLVACRMTVDGLACVRCRCCSVVTLWSGGEVAG